MSTGIDIVKISRLEKFPAEQFAKKILSEEELALPQAKKLQSLAASFAAKEAFSKALGTGIRGFDLKDVSVMRDSMGKPFFVFSQKLLRILESKGVLSVDVSLTHEKEYALAVVNMEFDRKAKLYQKAVNKFSQSDEDDIITPPMISDIITPRKKDIHKGDCGRCFVVAGSPGLTGAAILASKAVARCGAGLVTLGCAQSLNNIFEIGLTEVMTLPLPDTDGIINETAVLQIENFAKKCNCMLIGPGLSDSKSSVAIVENAVKNYSGSLVIDADGINALARNINILNGHKADIILTPHPGEFSRLTGISPQDVVSNASECAKDFSVKYGVVTVLKSHNTVVAFPDGRVYKNILGNPGMATGGSGDVLAGAIASFVAQGFGAENAAIAGVYIHSLAADMVCADMGEYGMLPSDICGYLPYAVKYSL